MSLASTVFTCSPVSIAVEDETEVSTCEFEFACAVKKGLVFASDLAFMEASIVEIVKGKKRENDNIIDQKQLGINRGIGDK